jgi:hypothetical protein
MARLRWQHVLLVWPVGLLLAYGLLQLDARVHPQKVWWLVPATWGYVSHALLRSSVSHPLVGIALLSFPCIPVLLTLSWIAMSTRRLAFNR